jgi:hypothetical protein
MADGDESLSEEREFVEPEVLPAIPQRKHSPEQIAEFRRQNDAARDLGERENSQHTGEWRTCRKCFDRFEIRQRSARPRTKCYDCQPWLASNHAQKNKIAASSLESYFGHLINRQAKIERSERLTAGVLVEKHKAQGGRCAISGMPMTHEPGESNVYNASPDRIKPRSQGGSYDPENVRLVCKLFQMMRMNLDDSVLQDAIIAAADHIKERRAQDATNKGALEER